MIPGLVSLRFSQDLSASTEAGGETRTLHFQRCARPEPELRRTLPEPVVPVVPAVQGSAQGSVDGTDKGRMGIDIKWRLLINIA